MVSSDVNKDLGFKAKTKAKDLGFKAKAKAKDLSFKAKTKAKDLSFKAKAKAKDLTQVLESRPRTWGSVLKDRQEPRTKAKDTSDISLKFVRSDFGKPGFSSRGEMSKYVSNTKFTRAPECSLLSGRNID